MYCIDSGSPWTGAGAMNPDKHAKDLTFLDSYSMERWEVSTLLYPALINDNVVAVIAIHCMFCMHGELKL